MQVAWCLLVIFPAVLCSVYWEFDDGVHHTLESSQYKFAVKEFNVTANVTYVKNGCEMGMHKAGTIRYGIGVCVVMSSAS